MANGESCDLALAIYFTSFASLLFSNTNLRTVIKYGNR
jgi:hypothetical protein